VVAAHRGALANAGLDIDTRLEAAPVCGDSGRLAQVFANLLQNSLRYTDAPGRIAVAIRREGQAVCAVWDDSAPGVSEEHLPRLTERLVRAEGSRSRAGGGSGLGLAIARAIAEAHGGTLTVGASPLGGLRVELTLPPWPSAS